MQRTTKVKDNKIGISLHDVGNKFYLHNVFIYSEGFSYFPGNSVNYF